MIAIGAISSSIPFLASCQDSEKSSKTQQQQPVEHKDERITLAAGAPLPVSIVTVSGKGWGVANKTSLVLSAQPEVKKVKLSGLQATVVLNQGEKLNQETITKQLAEKGLTLVSLEDSEVYAPTVNYAIQLEGTGWAETADKVRVALETMDGVSNAYVSNSIELHLDKDITPDEEAIKTAIADAGANFLAMEKSSDLSF